MVCIILTSVLRRSLLTSLSFLFWSTVQIHPAVSHCCSFLLAPTLCPAIQPNIFRKGLFSKADTAGCLQNDLFSASLSKLKIVCYIAVSPVSVAAAAKSLQSCLTLCNSIEGSPPGSPIPGILQARTLEWLAISFSSG